MAFNVIRFSYPGLRFRRSPLLLFFALRYFWILSSRQILSFFGAVVTFAQVCLANAIIIGSPLVILYEDSG